MRYTIILIQERFILYQQEKNDMLQLMPVNMKNGKKVLKKASIEDCINRF